VTTAGERYDRSRLRAITHMRKIQQSSQMVCMRCSLIAKGALWITRYDSGIVRIRYPRDWEIGNSVLMTRIGVLRAKTVFSAGVAYKLFEDHEGNIWVGCSKGLVQFRHNSNCSGESASTLSKDGVACGERGEISSGPSITNRCYIFAVRAFVLKSR